MFYQLGQRSALVVITGNGPEERRELVSFAQASTGSKMTDLVNRRNKMAKNIICLVSGNIHIFMNMNYVNVFTTGILKGPVALDSTMVEEDSDSPIIAFTAVFPKQVCSAVTS